MSLAEAADARKARLLALKKRKEGKTILKKHTQSDDVDMQDTVEKNVEGLAEQIITEDEKRREEEL
ncbi:hypothetical protein V5O48_015004, partial [Marasmius crinis-equi]